LDLQRLYSLTRQAIQDYDMISEGDHIAVGISGGKDSLTLLYALAGLQNVLSEEIYAGSDYR
jgi:tRNA 2-thiocytidine biosynthesis protein TtcA